MDWTQVVITLGAALLAGASGVVGSIVGSLDSRWKTKHDANRQRAEIIVKMYTEFRVTFQAALHANEAYWDGFAVASERNTSYSPPGDFLDRLQRTQHDFRDAAWALVVFETDEEQQARIEDIAKAFDYEPNSLDAAVSHADHYADDVKRLSNEARVIVKAMQKIHGKTLDLV